MPPKPQDQDEAAALRTAMGRRLRAAREKLGWSQERLAEAVGIGSAMLGRCERGTKFPSFVVFVRLAKTLGLSTDELLGLDERGVRATPYGRQLEKLTPRVREAMVLVVRELTSRNGAPRARSRKR